ncbi:unknown protein [Bathycoccus prasinos]|uniref:Uncharacterized protein n=1 Tax=Bathycoccus prasinos TaxID=41875 RepID=K8F518_9CHLO|nr:unknown protein [Bathycoccus prasinos]CCO16648.1 unknown protein [Bathycoccus prasinos]|eukprot:XP_007513090.1 unknown protein [Bathycoccus prasinos]
MFGKIQKCLPETNHTPAKTTPRATKITVKNIKIATHKYKIIFLNQIGANGNKHASMTKIATAQEAIKNVQLIGWSYVHA